MLQNYISDAVSAVKDYSAQIALGGLFAVVMGACSGVADTPYNPTVAPIQRASPTVTYSPTEAHTSNPTQTPNKVSSTIPQCEINYRDVKSGLISPKDYIKDLEQCMPDVVKAKESGMLKGFLYNPTETQLERVLTDLFSDYIEDGQFLQDTVQSSIDSYNSLSGKEAAALVPGIIDTFGQKLPIYIAFNEGLITSTKINNDADVQSIGIHELKHIDDWYNGITLGDIHLSFKTISKETFRLDFLSQLLELRATYTELEETFRETVETGKFSISPEWFGSQLTNYSNHREFLKNNATSELEERVRDLQFEQFEGIVPTLLDEGIFIQFDLFGVQRSTTLSKN